MGGTGGVGMWQPFYRFAPPAWGGATVVIEDADGSLLTVEQHGRPLLTVTLGGLELAPLTHYGPGGGAHPDEADAARPPETHPLTFGRAVPQEPYLVRPLATDVEGVELTAFLRGDEGGVEADLRLTSRTPLRSVAVSLTLDATGLTPRRLDGCQQPRPRAGAGVVAADLAGLTLLLDAGEEGTATLGGTSRLFDQFLERGVIVVARLAVRAGLDDGALAAFADGWFDRPRGSL